MKGKTLSLLIDRMWLFRRIFSLSLFLLAVAFTSGTFALEFTDAENGLRYQYKIVQREPFGDVAAVSGVLESDSSFNGTVSIPEFLPGKDGDVPVVELHVSTNFWQVGVKNVKNLILPSKLLRTIGNVIGSLCYLERLEMPLWLALEQSGRLRSWCPLTSTNSCLELVTRFDPCPTNGLPICELPQHAFSNLPYIDTIVLPPTVQSISSNAFFNCTRLRRVLCEMDPELLSLLVEDDDIWQFCDQTWREWQEMRFGYYDPFIASNTLRTVSTYAFSGCKNIEEVELPPCIEKIEPYAFKDCNVLKRVRAPDRLKVLGHKAFTRLPALEEVTFGTNLVMIGSYAFTSCRSLRHIKLPGSVVAVSSSSATNYVWQGRRIFSFYEGLMGSSVKDYAYVPLGLFANCTSLESVELGGFWFPSLPGSMFANCLSLTNVVLPQSQLRALATPVFRGCTALEELVVPDTVSTISTNAFLQCPNLKRLKLSATMASIPTNAFRGMTSLEEVFVSPNLRQIGEEAFKDCTALRMIELPDSVISVGGRAFWNCRSLETVHFASGVATLTDDVFEPDSRVSVDIMPAVRKTELFGDGKVRVLSAGMSTADPGKMIVRYEVVSSNEIVRVFPLAFVGGDRSFARVVRPVALENATAEIPANVERTLAWDVGADLGSDFSGTIQFGFVSDAGTAGTGTMLDGLFWQYASTVEGLTLVEGTLSAGGTTLANGVEVSSAASDYLSACGIDSHVIIHGESRNVNVRLATHRFKREVVLDSSVQQIFSVPGGGDGVAFAGSVMPFVADINADGLFDFVVVTPSTTNVYLNTGTKSSPEFRTAAASLATGLDAAPAALAEYPAIEAALRNGGISAEGLNVVILDWDGDGGTDALCGTVDGRLMLLADQALGRPTGLAGTFSPTSVNLSWTPSFSSAVRGYRVYRSVGKGGEAMCLEEPFTALSRFTDSPDVLDVDYWYRVSAVSRRYVVGNSEPEYTESEMSEPIYGLFGRVDLLIPDITTSTNGFVEVTLSILNTMDLSGNSNFTITYDPSVLAPQRTWTTTGLSEGFSISDSTDEDIGEWHIRTQGGKFPVGGGAFLRLRFEVSSEQATTTTVAVTEANISVVGNNANADIMPVHGLVIILPPPGDMPEGGVSYSLGDLDGNGVLDREDLRLLAKLKNANGRKWNAAQLRAGDFNGNGTLDNADYQALRALLKEKGLL